MPIRIQSRDLVAFDVDVMSDTKLINELRRIASEQFEANFQMYMTDALREEITERIMTSIEHSDTYDTIISRVTDVMTNQYMPYIVGRLKERVVADLIENNRFQTLINRNILAATDGVINETVERVTARFENIMGSNGDV